MDLEKLQAAIRRRERRIVLPTCPSWIVPATALWRSPVTIDDADAMAMELRDRLDKLRAKLLAELAARVN
jgi:hypothetical protein